MNTDHNCLWRIQVLHRCDADKVTREEEATLKFGNDLHLYHLRNTDWLVAVVDMTYFLPPHPGILVISGECSAFNRKRGGLCIRWRLSGDFSSVVLVGSSMVMARSVWGMKVSVAFILSPKSFSTTQHSPFIVLCRGLQSELFTKTKLHFLAALPLTPTRGNVTAETNVYRLIQKIVYRSVTD